MKTGYEKIDMKAVFDAIWTDIGMAVLGGSGSVTEAAVIGKQAWFSGAASLNSNGKIVIA